MTAGWDPVVGGLFGGLMVGTAICDFRTMRIPNAAVLALLGLFALATAVGNGPAGDALWQHAAGGAATLAVGLVLYGCCWVGAGDVKLVAALALWFGPLRLGAFFGMLALTSLGFLIAMPVLRGILPTRVQTQVPGGPGSAMAPVPAGRRTIPFAPPVAMAALLVDGLAIGALV